MAEKIHDKGYKRLFSNKQFFRELIESFVTEDWVKDIDFSDCQKIDKSFVSAHYKETESDIIYKVKFKNQDLYLFVAGVPVNRRLVYGIASAELCQQFLHGLCGIE